MDEVAPNVHAEIPANRPRRRVLVNWCSNTSITGWEFQEGGEGENVSRKKKIWQEQCVVELEPLTYTDSGPFHIQYSYINNWWKYIIQSLHKLKQNQQNLSENFFKAGASCMNRSRSRLNRLHNTGQDEGGKDRN